MGSLEVKGVQYLYAQIRLHLIFLTRSGGGHCWTLRSTTGHPRRGKDLLPRQLLEAGRSVFYRGDSSVISGLGLDGLRGSFQAWDPSREMIHSLRRPNDMLGQEAPEVPGSLLMFASPFPRLPGRLLRCRLRVSPQQLQPKGSVCTF